MVSPGTAEIQSVDETTQLVLRTLESVLEVPGGSGLETDDCSDQDEIPSTPTPLTFSSGKCRRLL